MRPALEGQEGSGGEAQDQNGVESVVPQLSPQLETGKARGRDQSQRAKLRP